MALIPKYDTPQTGAPTAAGLTPVSGGNATPDAFGAGVGQAQQQLGGAVEKVGDQFYSEAQAFQRQENEAAANEATTNYLVQQSKLAEDFKLLQGKDPQNALPKYLEGLKTLREQVRGGLTNPEVQRMFDQESTRQFGYAVMNAGAHAATQLKSYQNNQYNARIAATVHATTGAEEQATFEKGLDTIADAVRNGEFKGQAQEVIDGKIRDEQGKAWSARLQDVARNDPEFARGILNKNRAKIDGIVAQNAEAFINKMDVSRTSLRIANGVADGGVVDTKDQKIDYAMSFLTSKHGKAVAAGFVGNMLTENAGLDPTVRNATGHEGIVQWDQARQAEGKRWAKENGKDWYDFKTQVQFIDHELDNLEGETKRQLQGVTDPRVAAAIIDKAYERSEGNLVGRRQDGAVQAFNRSVFPIATVKPGNRDAMEKNAIAQANDYAKKNGLDDATREDLVTHTRSQIDSIYSKNMATQRDAAVGNKATLVQFVTSGPDGKNPVTSIDQVFGPNAPKEINDAYLQMNPQEQLQMRNLIKRNADATLTPTVPTDETRTNRQLLEGKMQLDPDAFLKIDPVNPKVPGTNEVMKLTRSDLSWLGSAQERIVSGKREGDEKAGNTDRAMRILNNARLLDINGLRPEDRKANPERYQRFQGGLSQLLDQYNLENNGKQPSEEDVKKMAKSLLMETVTSPGYFGTSFFETRTPRYQQGDVVRNAPKFESIPKDEVQKIQDAFREKGILNVTPQMIRRVYGKKMGASANAE